MSEIATQEKVIGDIIAERKQQDSKWGEQNHEDFVWLAVLSEEVGETAQAVLHDAFRRSCRAIMREV